MQKHNITLNNSALPENPRKDDHRPGLSLLKPTAGSPTNAMNSDFLLAQKAEILPKVTHRNLQQILDSVAIDPKEELQAPPVCLEIVQNEVKATVGTLGNFSLIIGKAKSRKTFFITIALAAAVRNDFVLNRFKGTFPDKQGTVLFFDTEQGKYHVQKAVKRVLKLSGMPEPKNFTAFGLRKFAPAERLLLIEEAINNTPDLGMVVIDGVRDLVTSINDEEQATMIASKLLKWSEEKNIHIVCVLHQNKGDNNARGHIGSELQNKAESVLSVAKSTEDGDISIVSPQYCREKEFEPFAFSIDKDGLPCLEGSWQHRSESGSGGNSRKSLTPSDITIEKHREILKIAFKNAPKPKLSELLTQLQLALEKFGYSIGESKAKKFKSWYQNEGLIEQEGIAGTKASYYTLTDEV